MKIKDMLSAVAALMLLVLLPAAVAAQAPVDVGFRRIVIPGFVEPNTPGAPGVVPDPALVAAVTDPAAFDANGSLNLNKSIYVRFFDKSRSAPPEAIVLLIPELEVGAGSLRIIAKEIVSVSEGRYEAWAIEHRGNLLEDLTEMVKAENQMTIEASSAALDAYMLHPAGRGGVLASNPFLAGSFATEWGLDVYLRDIRASVDRARTLTPNVFLGGHALGAVLTQMFAAYDFGDVAGHKLIKGMILLDGTSDPATAVPIVDEIYLNGGSGLAGLIQLRTPTTRPFQTEVNGSPKAATFQIVQIGSQFTIIDREDTTLQTLLPFFLRFPATNMAFMGLLLDDEFQRDPIARVSIGFLRVPPGQTLQDVATRVGNDPANLNPNGLWAAKDPGPGNIIQWDATIKDLSPLGPEFVQGREVSTTQALMRNALLIGAAENQQTTIDDTNSNQWFFPKRLRTDLRKLIDLGASPLSEAVINAQKEKGGNPITMTQNRRVNTPVLAIHAAQGGDEADRKAYKRYRKGTNIKRNNLTYAELEFYTHTDVLVSLEQTTTDGKNVPQLIVDFATKRIR